MTQHSPNELRPLLSPLSLEGAVEPFLVLADWLQERGDPWGNLIAIDALLEARSSEPAAAKAALENERRSILDEHGAAICPLHGSPNAHLVYRRGFVASAKIGSCATIDARELEARLTGLLSSPAATLLQLLDLSESSLGDRHVKALLSEKARLARARVDLRGNRLSAGAVRELRDALPKVDLWNQPEPWRTTFAESGSEHRAFIRAHGGPRSIEDIDD